MAAQTSQTHVHQAVAASASIAPPLAALLPSTITLLRKGRRINGPNSSAASPAECPRWFGSSSSGSRSPPCCPLRRHSWAKKLPCYRPGNLNSALGVTIEPTSDPYIHTYIHTDAHLFAIVASTRTETN